MKNTRDEALLLEIKDLVPWNDQSFNVFWSKGDHQVIRSSDVRQFNIEKSSENKTNNLPIFWLEFPESTNTYLQLSITEKKSSLST